MPYRNLNQERLAYSPYKRRDKAFNWDDFFYHKKKVKEHHLLWKAIKEDIDEVLKLHYIERISLVQLFEWKDYTSYFQPLKEII